MKSTHNCKSLFYLLYCIIGVFVICTVQSCGKESAANAAGLNIEYEVLNLSPDLGGVNLYVRFAQVKSTFIFNNSPAYFYVPYTDTPYLYRQAIVVNGVNTSGSTLITRDDVLKTGLKYSLFIFGSFGNNTLQQILTVDTAAIPAVGRGKVRFINISPTATAGLDVYANGTQLFKDAAFPSVSKFTEVPVGNYEFQLEPTGGSSILKDFTTFTVQDGRLYTIYAYGYTNRTDSAAFNGGIITNK